MKWSDIQKKSADTPEAVLTSRGEDLAVQQPFVREGAFGVLATERPIRIEPGDTARELPSGIVWLEGLSIEVAAHDDVREGRFTDPCHVRAHDDTLLVQDDPVIHAHDEFVDARTQGPSPVAVKHLPGLPEGILEPAFAAGEHRAVSVPFEAISLVYADAEIGPTGKHCRGIGGEDVICVNRSLGVLVEIAAEEHRAKHRQRKPGGFARNGLRRARAQESQDESSYQQDSAKIIATHAALL